MTAHCDQCKKKIKDEDKIKKSVGYPDGPYAYTFRGCPYHTDCGALCKKCDDAHRRECDVTLWH